MKAYIGSGIYVNDCQNGQDPITGLAFYTGYLNQIDSNNKAYCLAIETAANLRLFNPCLSDPTTTTTTTPSTTTPMPYIEMASSGNSLYDWTGDFNGESNAYYDIAAWGQTNGYLSGNLYSSNQYFSSISSNDMGGAGVVLAIIKGSGIVTGFGNNTYQQLNIPSGLTGVLQVSLGYDHVVALKNDLTLTGWGRDYWGALSFNNGRQGVKKVCAGIGSTIILTTGGSITGTSFIGGNPIYSITYPNGTFLDIDHYNLHILTLNSNGIVSGFGFNNFGETDAKYISGVSRISAGISNSMIVYSGGRISGYGTSQALDNVPYIGNSGVISKLRLHIGTILKGNQDIVQYVSPFFSESGDINTPTYLKNNIVSVDQGQHFTAAIFKRISGIINQSITGYNYLWKVTSVGGGNSYGGISVDNLYPPSSSVLQSCDGYSISLPSITNTGQTYTDYSVTNCSSYGGTHQVDFVSVYSKWPILNINYTKTGYAPKTGFAATGITTGDYWNPYLHTDIINKPLYYSNNVLSTISGGILYQGSGSGITFSHGDNMYASCFSGISGKTMSFIFSGFDSGLYTSLIYGHGTNSGNYSKIKTYLNGILIDDKLTSSGIYFNSSIFSGDNQYITSDFNINQRLDFFYIAVSGFINGIQFIRN